MKNMPVLFHLVVIFVCLCAAASVSAQGAPAASSTGAMAAPQTAVPTKNPVTASLRMLLPRSRNNTLGAISAMPADKFTYKPTADQTTFAHLVVHIIGSNNLL